MALGVFVWFAGNWLRGRGIDVGFWSLLVMMFVLALAINRTLNDIESRLNGLLEGRRFRVPTRSLIWAGLWAQLVESAKDDDDTPIAGSLKAIWGVTGLLGGLSLAGYWLRDRIDFDFWLVLVMIFILALSVQGPVFRIEFLLDMLESNLDDDLDGPS